MIGVDQIINNQTMVPAGEWSSSKTHTVSMRWPRIGTKAHTKNSSELAIHPRFPDIELLLFTHLFSILFILRLTLYLGFGPPSVASFLWSMGSPWRATDCPCSTL